MELTMNEFFRTHIDINKNDTGKGREAIDKGRLDIHKYGGYYNRSNTILIAVANNPNDFDVAGYNREQIWAELGRNAEEIQVSNDEALGRSNLFAIVSQNGVMSFSPEIPIYPRQTATFFNVFEIRLRSPKLNLAYRVSEYHLDSLI